jgi:hypothetical protein
VAKRDVKVLRTCSTNVVPIYLYSCWNVLNARFEVAGMYINKIAPSLWKFLVKVDSFFWWPMPLFLLSKHTNNAC